jgi:predicted TIM-barrel fold metal-dependent hydrolase
VTLRLLWCAIAVVISSPLLLQGQSQPVVDHHQHFFGPAVTTLTPGVAPIMATELVVLLDSAGIRRAVVLSLAYQFGNPNRPPVENEYEQVKTENDFTSRQVARFPQRLLGFCSVNPLKDYALDEIARCARIPQLQAGLKIHFGNSDVDLNNPQHIEQLRRVFSAANNLQMAMVVHMRSSVTRKRSYGANEARIFLNDLLPAAPDVPVQIAHLAGAGGYDDPLVDEALAVFVAAIANHDARMAHVFFDISGVAGLGDWKGKVNQVAERIRQLGVERILYGSDGAADGNLTPREAWAAFRKLPLTEFEFRTIASNIAPYLR